MEVHEFDIEIRPDGKVAVHIRGVKGAACMEYTKLFEQILAGSANVELTAEYYEPPTGVQIRVEQQA
jgi:hypothetical protein